MKQHTITHNGRSIQVYDLELVYGMIRSWVASGMTKEEALDFLFEANEYSEEVKDEQLSG